MTQNQVGSGEQHQKDSKLNTGTNNATNSFNNQNIYKGIHEAYQRAKMNEIQHLESDINTIKVTKIIVKKNKDVEEITAKKWSGSL